MKKRSEKQLHMLDVSTILSAQKGDAESIALVLSHYQNYICRFALQKVYDEQGSVSVHVDEFFRRSLETKLMEAILKYHVPNH